MSDTLIVRVAFKWSVCHTFECRSAALLGHQHALSQCTSVFGAVSAVVVEFLCGVQTGKHRPTFLSVCQPDVAVLSPNDVRLPPFDYRYD